MHRRTGRGESCLRFGQTPHWSRPGNTPVYLEKTAQLDMAVVDIITSKTFDNGTICASEQTVVIDDEIYDTVLRKFADLGAHICDEKETGLLDGC